MTLADIRLTKEEILADYRLAFRSRQASYIGRREVLSGKAKFGIFGDGKELPQLAMARAFKKGDFRSGYYRDQTLMFALGVLTIQQFFAELYAHTDLEADPSTAGRCMIGHFNTRSINPDGSWKDLTVQFNSSPDVSPTAAQMPRLVGLAYASKLYLEMDVLHHLKQFSNHGNEVAFGTIGNASCAEGLFWESVNAIGVLRVPAIITIYDDSYGISVSNEHQIAKENISELLMGFQRPPGSCCDGFDIYSIRGWDYPALLKAYIQAAEVARSQHMPSIIHVSELTQPQGHSTSGSHERYKSKERLEWETQNDCLKKFREWILAEGLVSARTLENWEDKDRRSVEDERKHAWQAYIGPIQAEIKTVAAIFDQVAAQSKHAEQIKKIKTQLQTIQVPFRRDAMAALSDVLLTVRDEAAPAKEGLLKWKRTQAGLVQERFGSHLHIEPGEQGSALAVSEQPALYSDASPTLMGFEILNTFFDGLLKREPRLIVFGEDVGRLGDVNQAFRGLQEKYGLRRGGDTGIREATILGQAIGLSMRGLRPIAEIQYLDYVLYALQLMADDLSTMLWRTKGGHKAPVIVRTRGHRLEGVWHSGSPMAGIINLVRGMYVATPRNMVQAAGLYNTLIQAEEPALLVEVLNGYRAKERRPDNLDKFCVPLGKPEILSVGTDITLVTYGACVRIVMEAAERLAQVGIQCEVIDVQTLLPFDLHGVIGESLKKTNRVVFIDEDVPGGTSAYMLQQVLENQQGYQYLDSPPVTISAAAHRPAYGSDGDYWSKPNREDIFEKVYQILNETNPKRFPIFY